MTRCIYVYHRVWYTVGMKLSTWAKEQGISYQAAWRMYRDGKLPVPVEQLPTGTIIVKPPKEEPAGVAVYARVSSSDQRSDLDGQVARVVAFVTHKGWPVVRTVTEVGSGLNGHRPKLMKVLADPSVAIVAVEHRERLMRFGAEYEAHRQTRPAQPARVGGWSCPIASPYPLPPGGLPA